MIDPITMVEVLSNPNAHAWPMYPLKLNLQVLIETKHGSLQFYLKEERQSVPNGCLKLKKKIMGGPISIHTPLGT
jgi:hypothetical protein